ncbi:MAG: Cu(I)/Ag(I) efflux system rane fusion protein [Gammaproteobacteria bacterium]|nr:Cu(I)/Ag(I) efflux system rane fusion protein [Gammaproteobacteria bacterium]
MKKKVRLPLIIASLLLAVATSALFGTYWNVIMSGLQRGGMIITTLLDDLYQPKSQKMDETVLGHAIKHLDPTYYCPMHPQVTSHEPGRCPICGMDLVALASAESEPMADTGERKILFYRHPMDPAVTSDTPQKDSMGMDFIPIYADETQGSELLVTIAPEIEQNLGVRIEKVERTTLSRRIDTVGYVGYNESLIGHVHLRTEGWIENLAVNTIGDRVAKGDLLFTLYSPTLVNAQEEYLQAQERSNERLINASRQKLKALGVSASQIETLAQTRKAERTINIFAHQAGVVSDLKVREGMYVEPATETITLVDLGSVWLQAEVFERQAAWVEIGQQAEARIQSLSVRTWKGSVDYIYPDLDPVTRTLKVRLRFDAFSPARAWMYSRCRAMR